jgi:hypothetical protein
LRQKADIPAPMHRRQLTTWQVICQVERRFYSWESNDQSLPWDLGISPPSSSRLRSSHTYILDSSVCILTTYVDVHKYMMISHKTS